MKYPKTGAIKKVLSEFSAVLFTFEYQDPQLYFIPKEDQVSDWIEVIEAENDMPIVDWTWIEAHAPPKFEKVYG